MNFSQHGSHSKHQVNKLVMTKIEIKITSRPILNFTTKNNMSKNQIHFKNGTYDFGTNTFHESPEKIPNTNYPYEPNVDHKVINKYFRILFQDDKVRQNIKRELGRMLTCDTHKVYYQFVGAGANGKSRFVMSLALALGDYFKVIDDLDAIDKDTRLYKIRNNNFDRPMLKKLDRLMIIQEGNCYQDELLTDDDLSRKSDIISFEVRYDKATIEFSPMQMMGAMIRWRIGY